MMALIMYWNCSARAAGVTIRGVAHRCGEQGPGTARCEWPVGHDGPVMPPNRHVGRDDTGEWQSWDVQPVDVRRTA